MTILCKVYSFEHLAGQLKIKIIQESKKYRKFMITIPLISFFNYISQSLATGPMNKPADKFPQNRYVQNLQLKDHQSNLHFKQNPGTLKATNNRQQLVDAKTYGNIQFQRKRQTIPEQCKIPSPRGFFQRSRSRQNYFRERNSVRNNDIQNNNSPNATKQPPIKADSALRLTQLKKRLSMEMQEKQKLKQAINQRQLRISALNQQLVKLKQQLKWFQQQLQKSSAIQQEKSKELMKTQQMIQNLNKVFNAGKNIKKESKQTENKVEILHQKIQKLIEENVDLAKKISELKLQNSGKRPQIVEQDKHFNKQTLYSLHLQINRLKRQLEKDKSERERLLESTIRQLQSKLYQKEKDLRKSSVHINLMGRKHTMSIDQVRQKKDQEIKQLRQRFIKVSKDLKQTKIKIEKSDKKRNFEKDPSLRKIKSQKQVKFGSDTDDFTFELSSQA